MCHVLQDVSISVRKQAVVALKDFLLSHLEHSLAPDVMLCIINRISDEEQVKVCFKILINMYRVL